MAVSWRISIGSVKSVTRNSKMPRMSKKTVKAIPFARGFKRPNKKQQNVAIGHTTNNAYKNRIDSFFHDLPFPTSPDDWLAQYVEEGQTV